MIKDIDILKDERVNCYSVMIQLSLAEYRNMVKTTFENRGGLEGQRDTLKATTAIRIRNRMVKDVEAGAVLPPIVLGVIVAEETFSTLETLDRDSFLKLLEEVPNENISIIDGMQRTTALFEALKNADIGNRKIRIEYWIAFQVNNLTYRMLVLNTGQVPWNLRRQIEIVFRSIIKELKEKFSSSIEIMEINEERRRSNPGQFQADNVIELFLVFGARKEKIDLQEKLADEFTRLDFIESTANSNFTNIFYEVMDYLARLDQAIAVYKDENLEGYFKEGKDLFSSQPACVGFVTSIALSVLGRPGFDYDSAKQNERWKQIKEHANNLLQKLSKLNNQEMGIFLDFLTLNEIIRKKPGKSSYFEREFFLQAFKVLIEENFDLENMTPCWRAY